MYTIRKYSDGATEIGKIDGGDVDVANVQVVRRPVNLPLLCALVVVAVAVLYYRVVVLRGRQYDGLWVLEPGKKVVELRTGLRGSILILDNEAEIGAAAWCGDHLELDLFGKKNMVAPHDRLMIGSSVSLRRVESQSSSSVA